jgi:hypothetical protein
VLAAKGMQVGSARAGGRHLSYATVVQSNGSIVIGQAYARLMGLTHGSVMKIALDTATMTITLQLAPPAGEAESA